MLIQSACYPTSLPCAPSLSSDSVCVSVWGVKWRLLSKHRQQTCHCMRSAVKATYKRMGQLSYMTCVSSPSLFQVSARSHAPTATEPSLTAPTCGPICRPTLRWRSTSVVSALAPSVACLCCRNTAPQGAAPPGFETPKRQKGPTQSSGRWKGHKPSWPVD